MAETIRTQSYTVSRAEYLRAMWTRRLWVPIAIVGGVILVLLLAAASQYGTAPLVGGVPILLFYLGLIVALRYLLTRRNYYSPAARKTFDVPRIMEISDESVYVQTEDGAESRLPWTYFVSAEIRGPFLLLFTNAIVHLILPLSAFATDADRTAALDVVRQRRLLPSR